MSLRREYETTIIVNAALEDPDVEALITKVTGYLENHGATIQETGRWGRRRLAYPINKKYNGYYIHLVFEANPSTVPILERFLVLEDTVLRHLTLVLPKKLREYREKRALEGGIAYGEQEPEAEQPVIEERPRRRQGFGGRNRQYENAAFSNEEPAELETEEAVNGEQNPEE